MKKLLCLILSLCLLAALGGCNGDAPEETTLQTTESTTPEEPRELDIYYLRETLSTAQSIVQKYTLSHRNVSVNATAFNSIEEMDLQIASEISAGKGPDVILFPDTTTLDTAKMAQNGAFLDLSEMMAADITYSAENYYPVLTAGQIGGGQYLMPLRMKFMYMMTTQKKFSDVLSLEEGYTLQQLMQALTVNAAQCPEDKSAMHTMHKVDTYLYDLLRLSNIQIVDTESLTQTVSRETVEEYAAFAQMAYGQMLKAAGHMREYSPNDLAEACRRNTVILTDQSMPGWVRYYGAIYDQALNEEFQLISYPNQTDANKVTVDIPLYAAVVKKTDNAQDAYSFVRYAMDYSFSNINEQLPVSKQGVTGLLNNLSANTGKTITVHSFTVKVGRMTAEQETYCKSLLDRITSGSIPNAGIEAIFTEAMGSYITGEADFDSCYQKFENQLGIYLYE